MRRLIPALILIACTASAASDSLWANLRARYLGLKTLTGTFEEQICSDQAGTCQNFSGKFSIGVPDRYRLDVTEPQKQVIVSDGSSLWLYFPDQKRAMRQPAGGLTPVLAFLGPVLDTTARGLVARDSSGAWSVAISTDDSMAAFLDLKLELTDDARRIRAFSFVDAWGNSYHFSLLDQKWNAKVPDKTFKFAPPAGVEVEQ
jgi:outer membrane lipoprotein carrier protein